MQQINSTVNQRFVFTVRHGQRSDFVLHEPISENRDAEVKFNTNQPDYLADP